MYKDFLVKILESDEKMNEIFGPTVATAEKAGDVIKFWLGLLDIAAMTKGVINIFDERSIRRNISMDLKLPSDSSAKSPEPPLPSIPKGGDLLIVHLMYEKLMK